MISLLILTYGSLCIYFVSKTKQLLFLLHCWFSNQISI